MNYLETADVADIIGAIAECRRLSLCAPVSIGGSEEDQPEQLDEPVAIDISDGDDSDGLTNLWRGSGSRAENDVTWISTD